MGQKLEGFLHYFPRIRCDPKVWCRDLCAGKDVPGAVSRQMVAMCGYVLLEPVGHKRHKVLKCQESADREAGGEMVTGEVGISLVCLRMTLVFWKFPLIDVTLVCFSDARGPLRSALHRL